ncbi:MAG: AAA-like domain-containing protein [Cyanobacteria bacterium P01_D01_bin.50]
MLDEYIHEYIFSGSLPENASTYVKREADDELYEALHQGKFCYVLNSRQSGKSSLRLRTMSRLSANGVECASIDLSSINIQSATQENWYADLITKLIDSFVLDVDFENWWKKNQLNSPLMRFSNFLEKHLLVEIQEPVVIFIDEIDSVLSLNFPTDDFFAFIRACYNQQVDNLVYKHLTFCLLGVASPSNLIQDKQRTPFNVGKAISLKGFKLHEVEPLERGLKGKFSHPQTVMQEILNWTGGQPFLTQKLCQFMVEESEKEKPRNVEQVVKSRIIESWESQDEPEHLRTIRARILRNEERAAYLLELYQQIRRLEEQSSITADNTIEQSELLISGLVARRKGKLQVYNAIYKEVFNNKWIENELKNLRPYSESFKFWVASEGKDESRLLRGKALADALYWAEDKNLSYQDKQFLAASREKEIQEKIAAEEQEAKLVREMKYREAVEQINLVLSEANIKAKQRIRNGTIVLILALLGTVVLGILATREGHKALKAQKTAEEAELTVRQAEDKSKEIRNKLSEEMEEHKSKISSLKIKMKSFKEKVEDATKLEQKIIENKKAAEKELNLTKKSLEVMKKQLKDLQHNSFNETSQIRSLTSKTQGDLLKQHQQANAEFMKTSETRNKLKEKRKRGER